MRPDASEGLRGGQDKLDGRNWDAADEHARLHGNRPARSATAYPITASNVGDVRWSINAASDVSTIVDDAGNGAKQYAVCAQYGVAAISFPIAVTGFYSLIKETRPTCNQKGA